MARKREVFKDYDALVAAWIKQKQPTGRTPRSRLGMGRYNDGAHGSRLTFEGDILYSYGHFPIAKIIKPGIAFVTTDYWTTTVQKSPTTERHKAVTDYQLRHNGYNIFYLPSIDRDRSGQLTELQAEVLESIAICHNTRLPNTLRRRLGRIREDVFDAKEFAKCFDLPYDRTYLKEPLAAMAKKQVKNFRRILIEKTKERLHI